MLKACFVAPYAYSLFNQATRHVFGGSEVRAWTFATALARRPGFEVSFVVFDHGQPDGEMRGGVRLVRQRYYRSYEVTPGAPGRVRRVTRRIADMVDRRMGPPPSRSGERVADGRKFIAYLNADADVFIGFGVTDLSAELIAFCRRAGKRIVLFAGSDNDFSERYVADSYAATLYGNTPHLCHYAIGTADALIVQTERQRAMCAERFGRSPDAVIANPIALNLPEDGKPNRQREGHALWIGKSDQVKRPDMLLDLARRFPDLPFFMLMNRSDVGIHERVLAARPPNVTIVDHLPYDQADHLFRAARVIVNTSVFEGFPNTFLQAGKYGVPILSLSVDPDRFIEAHGCGIVAGGDMDELARGLRRILDDRERAAKYAQNVHSYVRGHHDIDTQIGRLEEILTGQAISTGNRVAGMAG